MDPEYATAKEARKSKLPISEQDKCIVEQGEVVNILVDRLDAILTPPRDKAVSDISKAEPAIVEQSYLAHELESNNARIRRNTRKLNDILDRLEL